MSTWYLSPIDQGILKGWHAWKYVSSVEAPKEPQPLLNDNTWCMKKYQSFSPREFELKKTVMTTRKNLFAFLCITTCTKVSYCSILYCNVIWNTVSICCDPDTSKHIDKRNRSPLQKTILVPMKNYFWIHLKFFPRTACPQTDPLRGSWLQRSWAWLCRTYNNLFLQGWNLWNWHS